MIWEYIAPTYAFTALSLVPALILRFLSLDHDVKTRAVLIRTVEAPHPYHHMPPFLHAFWSVGKR
jgi:hypothetical protein